MPVSAADTSGDTPPAAGKITGPVTIAVNTDAFPYSYRDEKDGALKGFAVDLTRAIGRVMNIDWQLEESAAGEVTGSFMQGKARAIQIFSRSPERAVYADFSVPYLAMVGAVVVRKDNTTIHGPDDLRGKKVLVHPHSVGESYLMRHGLEDCIVKASSVPDALRRLSAGEADAALSTRLTSLCLAKHHNLLNIEARGPSLDGFNADYCFAVQRGDAALLANINEGMMVLRASGEFDQIYDKWFGDITPKGYSTLQIMGALLTGLSVAVAVLLYFGLRSRALVARVRRSEELYRGVFESAHEAMFVLEPGRGEQAGRMIVQQANATACRLFGVSASAVLGQSLCDVMHESPDLCQRLMAAKQARGPQVFEHEYPIDGQNGWLMVSLTQLEARYLLVLTNLSEIKKTQEQLQRSEQQLRQTQKLEAIGTMASGIAHDFNNILTGIMGNAELAKMDIADKADPLPSIDQILVSADRARQLVRQILTFSRRAEARREVQPVTPIIAEALRLVRAATPASIRIQHNTGTGLPPVEVDGTQLHQVLMNLCTNAVHAMKGRNGQLEVSDELVSVEEVNAGLGINLQPGSYVRISVRDTGCGMPPDVMAKIFDPFFTTKGPGEGTGLGLSVVHGIVQKHGGGVTVYSQLGLGTVFKVYLPVAGDRAQPQATSGPASLAQGHGERIMLVDDEAVIVKAASAMLTRLGYEVQGFTSPVDALDAFLAAPERVDLLLSDLTMPGMSGLDLAQKMLAVRPNVPLLLMSGFVGETELSLVARLGFAGVLDKPLAMSVLSQKVAEALRARK